MKNTIQKMIKQANNRGKNAGRYLLEKQTRKELILESLERNCITKKTIKNHVKDSQKYYGEESFDDETIAILKSLNFI